MERRVLNILLFLFIGNIGFGQVSDTTKRIYVAAKVVDGDTIITTNLPPITIGVPQQFESRHEEKKYWKLVYNLKKVYPYARLARTKLDEMNQRFLTIKNEKEKKDYTKRMEKEIRDEFEEQLKSLTITQGKLLIKLIYRETGNTSYDLVKELRGTMSAVFWQALARIFGSNLKMKYDPTGDDKLIEDIVVSIENGLI
jgi:hypothetical protein